MKKHHTPRRINKENHLKVIIVLLCVVIVLGVLSRRGVWSSRGGKQPATPLPPQVEVVQAIQKPQKTQATRSRTERTTPRSVSGSGERLSSKAPEKSRKAGSSTQARIEHLEYPACSQPEFLVVHPTGRYTLCYDTTYRQAAWVAYVLTRADVRTTGVERSNRFRRDPEILKRGWPSASDEHYKGGPFDRGHLLPSSDRRGNVSENRETFYFSNISPQYPAVNRGVWKSLEEQVRQWADRYDSLYVVTGPELVPGLARRAGGVGIPRRYFKALLVCRQGRWEAVAFLIPNTPKVAKDFQTYRMTVDQLESVLGADFFYQLPDEQENRAESRVDTLVWR